MRTRKYQPKRLTERHKAALRATFMGEKCCGISSRLAMSESQIARIVHSELGRDYLRGLHDQTTKLLAEAAAARALYPIISGASRVA